MAERRYFRIFSTRHYPKDSQYYRLFQAISAQEHYDEESLTKRFSRDRSPAHFAVLKRQLFDALLEALHHFETYDDPVQQLIRGVHYCQLLLQRGLFDACAKAIRKFKAEGYALEQYEYVIALLAVEKKLASRQQYVHHDAIALDALEQEELQCLHFIQLNAAYWKHSAHMYKLHYAKAIGPGKDNTALEQLVQHPLFTENAEAPTFLSQLDKLQIQALHAFASQDAPKAFLYNRAFLELMDAHPHLRHAHADRYFATLNNYLIDCVILEQHDALLEGIDVLRALPADRNFRHITHIHAQVYRTSHLLLMNFYVGRQDFASAHSIQQQLRADWHRYARHLALPHVVTLLYLSAYIEMANGQFDACLDTLQMLFNIRHAEDISDLYASARVLQILAHFEKGDILLIDALINAFNRSGATKTQRAETYSVIFRFLKRAIKHPQKPLRQLLQKNLHQLNQEATEKKVFNNFNFIWWVEHVTKMT